MADHAEKEKEEDTEEKKPKAGLGLLPTIGIIFGAILVMLGGFWFMFSHFMPQSATAEKDGKKPDTEEKSDKKEKKAAKAEEEEEVPTGKPGIYIPIKCDEGKDVIIVNPRGSSSRYVVLSVSVEIDEKDKDKKKEVEEDLKFPICDKITSILSDMTIEQFQNPAKRDSLRLVIKTQIKPYFGEIKLKRVLFTKFIIQ